MKKQRLSARGGSALGGKKLILSVTLAIAAGVFLLSGTAFGGANDVEVQPTSHDFGWGTETFIATLEYKGWGYDVRWFRMAHSPHWLHLDPDDGWFDSPGDTVEIEASIHLLFYQYLSYGLHTGTVVFKSGSGIPYDYAYLDISIYKPYPPSISISPGSHDFGASQTNKQFTVQNLGEVTLTWSATSGASWVSSISPANGSLVSGASQPMTVMVASREMLDPGIYSGTISFSGNGGSPSIPIKMKNLAIEGRIMEDGVGLDGVTVNIGSYTKTTQGGGYYSKKALPAGNYTVTASYLDYGFGPPSYSFSLSNDSTIDDSKSGVDFHTYNIFGYVTRYGTGEGINGIIVTISGGGLDTPIELTTDYRYDDPPSDPGYYEKLHVGSGTYTIQPSNPE